MLCINTDLVLSNGDPEPALAAAARAGFSHVHWCHHWDDDFLYSRWEIRHIARLLQRHCLRLGGIHASQGQEKHWASSTEHQRRSGLELVINRMKMARDLEGGCIVLHVPPRPADQADIAAYWRCLERSVGAMEKAWRQTGVRVAFENGLLTHNAHLDVIGELLTRWPAEFAGVCYDSGHGNIDGEGLAQLEGLKDRLIATHLHDNDGQKDQHRLPFSGSVDWQRLAGILARSTHVGPLTLELVKPPEQAMEQYLGEAFKIAQRFAQMVEDRR